MKNPFYDEHLLSKYEIKIGSLRKTLLSLLEKDILDKKENRYYFQDISLNTG